MQNNKSEWRARLASGNRRQRIRQYLGVNEFDAARIEQIMLDECKDVDKLPREVFVQMAIDANLVVLAARTQDALSHGFFGKSYSNLTDWQRLQIDAKLSREVAL